MIVTLFFSDVGFHKDYFLLTWFFDVDNNWLRWWLIDNFFLNVVIVSPAMALKQGKMIGVRSQKLTE